MGDAPLPPDKPERLIQQREQLQILNQLAPRPESNLSVYIGIGIAVAVLGIGGYLLFRDR